MQKLWLTGSLFSPTIELSLMVRGDRAERQCLPVSFFILSCTHALLISFCSCYFVEESFMVLNFLCMVLHTLGHR